MACIPSFPGRQRQHIPGAPLAILPATNSPRSRRKFSMTRRSYIFSSVAAACLKDMVSPSSEIVHLPAWAKPQKHGTKEPGLSPSYQNEMVHARFRGQE